jgi:hypothetical protein
MGKPFENVLLEFREGNGKKAFKWILGRHVEMVEGKWN